MAKEDTRVARIDTSDAQNSVKELRQQLKELRNTMLSAEHGTEEYNEALRKAADIQHTLKEQMEEVNATAMDFGQIVSNSTKAIGGIVGSFQAATAVMNLFGVENENVIHTLKTMQQMMAITQALPAIDSGVKAFKRLGIAIKGASDAMKGLSAATIATGLGAITFALGLLIANWDKVSAAMKNWGIIHEDTAKKLEEEKKKIDDLRESYRKWQEEQRRSERADKVSNLNETAKKQYDELQKQIDELAKSEKDYRYKAQIAWKTEGKAAGDALKKQADDIKTQSDLLVQQQNAILANADSYKKLEKAGTESTDNIEKEYNELEVTMQNFISSLSPDSLQRELDAKFGGEPLKIPFELEEEDEDTKGLAAADALRAKYEGIVQSFQEAYGKTEEERYAQEQRALEWALENKKISIEEYNKYVDALNKEQTQREIQRYATAAGAIGDIFSSLGDMMEEGSEEQKAFQIMGATVNMLGGIATAISGAYTTHSGPWDIALAALQAAAIAASGGATIAKMAKANKNNSKSLSKTSVNTASTLVAPVQYTKDVQGASIESTIKDQRVYVVESDITSTQNKVDVAESEATWNF